MQEKSENIRHIYTHLLSFFGPQGWWPGETRLEVIVGAILTQNVSWKNVEKSIENIKSRGLMNMESLLDMDENELQSLIRPAGYYRQKSKRLREMLSFVKENYGSIDAMSCDSGLRDKLLKIKGIGKETADSIMLYALDMPVFVVDAYTLRIFKRMGIIDDDSKERYEEVREMVELALERKTEDLKEFHALLVELGKRYCRKKPECEVCPLNGICSRNI